MGGAWRHQCSGSFTLLRTSATSSPIFRIGQESPCVGTMVTKYRNHGGHYNNGINVRLQADSPVLQGTPKQPSCMETPLYREFGQDAYGITSGSNQVCMGQSWHEDTERSCECLRCLLDTAKPLRFHNITHTHQCDMHLLS